MKKLLTILALSVAGLGTAFGQPPPPPPGGGTVDYQLTFTSGSFDAEISYDLVPTAGGAAIRSVACGAFNSSLVDTVSLTEGVSYDFNAYDDWGDGWNGATYTITRIPCGDIVNSEAPTNGLGGDNSDACDGSDLESTFTFVAAACPTCPNPAGLSAVGTSSMTATVTWVDTVADFYAMEYGPAGFTPDVGAGTQIAPASSPQALSGLTPGMVYDVYVVAGCGTPIPSDFSEYVMTSFFTPITNDSCGAAMTIPVGDDTTIVMNGSTLDGPAISCSLGAEDDAWVKFVGTGTPVDIYGSVAGASTDWAMEIWEGCPNAGGTIIACEDDINFPANAMPGYQFCTSQGVEYFLRLWEYGTSDPGMIMGITVKEIRPEITGFSNIGQNGATVSFNAYTGGDAEAQVIRSHVFGDSPNFMWRNLNPWATSGYRNNLEPNTRYTVRVGTRCPGENAAYGDTATFWTRPMPCASPSWTSDSIVGQAYLTWENTGADSYKVRYRMVGGSWTWVNTTDTWLFLTLPFDGATYEWQVRGICNEGGNKPYGAMDMFTMPNARLASTEVTEITSFNLYPNPTDGLVTVDFASGVAENITFNVMDLGGKIVFSNTVAANEGSNRVNIDLNDLEAGVYLTTLSNANGVSERVRVILK